MAAGFVAFVAALQMVNGALGAQAQIGVDTAQMDLASLVCGVLPFVGFVGAALARKRRLTGRLLVLLGGFGTCAAAAVSAVEASVAALIMIVANAIDLRATLAS
jgi:hypothetical protein